MSKRVSATDAKNNFGGLLDDVAALGRVDIVKHGRLVAVVLSPRSFNANSAASNLQSSGGKWGKTHMIPPRLARSARMVRPPRDFDGD